MKRIWLLAPEMAAWGGIQAYMWRLWEVLVARGDPRGWVLNDSQPALQSWPNESLDRPQGARRGRLTLLWRMLSQLRHGDTIVVGHVHLAPLAWLASHVFRISYVVVLHGIEAWSRLGWLQRRSLARAFAVVSTTTFTKDLCQRENSLSSAHFRVLPLCLPHNLPAASGKPVLSGDWPVLFVGRLAVTEARKGLDSLIKAAHLLKHQGRHLTVHVVGDGDDRPRIEALARSLGLDDDTLVLHGHLPPEAMPDCYASAKVFVMPSAKEGFGIVFLEAMQQGTPCIGGAHGGTPEVFSDGREGLLVRHGDVPGLAAALMRLMDSPDFLDRIGQAAHARYLADYTFSAFQQRWAALLSESTPS